MPDPDRKLNLDTTIEVEVEKHVAGARKVVAFGVMNGITCSGMSASLSYFDAFRTGRLPLNLIQAQRDHFGSHTYERLDRNGIFHTEW